MHNIWFALSPTWHSIIFAMLTVFLAYKYLTRNHNYWKDRGVPFVPPVFLAGSLWEVFSGKAQIGRHLGHLYTQFPGEPYFGIYIMGKPYLVIRNPDIIKNITIRDFANFDDRTFACDKKADPMAGNSLFIMRNPDWKNIRNKLTPIFTSGKLKLMVPLMKKHSNDMVKYLETATDKTLNIKDVSANYMTDLVASCFFGIDSYSFGEVDSDFRIFCQNMFNLGLGDSFRLFCYFFIPKFVYWFKFRLFDTTFLQNVFNSTLKYREEKKFNRNDFVDLLIGIRDTFNEKNSDVNVDTNRLVSLAITFFVAGFETTSNALAFALYELCVNEKCQEKLREEINKVIKTEDDITFENVQSIKYLEMVICETLRRYPFGPFLNRNCKEDYVIQETGFKIEKDTPVLVPIDGLHNDPEYFPEPEKFDPERFADGSKHLVAACKYLPFGNGPRNCIGDRFGGICAKVGLVYFLRKYRVEKCPTTPVPVVLEPKSPFMTPIHGLPMIVRKL
ncbi:cytochrome P450 6k1-like isoform X2 [Aethina tumida]|uniref:cytochrome P450 6k1-like isoform X2 n=1 Tax=Aethina tumida TaxID=116153 RepID=UPI002148C4B5|nr:cytochrome P450 6k1-like isoform X2 [Aethina tumida]